MAVALVVASLLSAPFADLSWMSGYWLSCEGREVSETWSRQQRDVLLGMSITVGGDTVAWEQTRIIAAAGHASFFAMPSGQAAAEFKSIELGDKRVVFENREHDFPQRVIYSRKGDVLTGRIEGTVNGETKAMEWRYTKASFNSHCAGR